MAPGLFFVNAFSFNEGAKKCRASKVIGINKYGINSQALTPMLQSIAL